MIREETQLVLGRGEVYFEPFIGKTRVGDGERYIGNTTTFQLARAVTRIERFTTAKGQKMEKESVVLSESHTVQFITDHISLENVGLWFGEETSTSVFNARGIVTENIRVRQNRFYQLGKTYLPRGVKYVENVSVMLDDIEIPAENNWSVDNVAGRIQIIAGSPAIPNGATIVVKFEWHRVTTEAANSHTRDLFGSLRFVATNPVGLRRDYFFPFVRLSARGSIDLKGDEWQQMPFEADALRLNHRTEQVYIDTAMGVGLLYDQQGIVDEGLTFAEFPPLENEIDILTNIDIPDIGLEAPLIYPE